jgi:hypothetical protein
MPRTSVVPHVEGSHPTPKSAWGTSQLGEGNRPKFGAAASHLFDSTPYALHVFGHHVARTTSGAYTLPLLIRWHTPKGTIG